VLGNRRGPLRSLFPTSLYLLGQPFSLLYSRVTLTRELHSPKFFDVFSLPASCEPRPQLPSPSDRYLLFLEVGRSRPCLTWSPLSPSPPPSLRHLLPCIFFTRVEGDLNSSAHPLLSTNPHEPCPYTYSLILAPFNVVQFLQCVGPVPPWASVEGASHGPPIAQRTDVPLPDFLLFLRRPAWPPHFDPLSFLCCPHLAHVWTNCLRASR